MSDRPEFPEMIRRFGGTATVLSPGERLEAAIEKLEALKAESTQPTGGKAWIQGRPWRHYEKPTEVYTGEMSIDSQDIVHGLPEPADAELIVTLHRTIDAQIYILKAALVRKVNRFGEYVFADEAVALAGAILGGA